jgi:S-formylglutathione hydrolase
MKLFLLLRCALALSAATLAAAQPGGTVERIHVHGKSLEGNLEDDSPDPDVAIYLPPSYSTDRARRFPVVYLLHGFTDDIDHWWGVKQHFISVPAVADKAFASGQLNQMILVMPNAFTRYEGSMYSTSATTGDWETFIARELVAYIDAHYRTIANVRSRGLAGHSMGGYGAARIGMKYPEVFSSVYLLSPCCMAAGASSAAQSARVAAVQTREDQAKLDFGTKAALASAAAWSPNPNNPPLFLDLPYANGELRPEIAAKWAANAPLAMIDQYIPNLKQLRALAFDAGDQDASIAATCRTLDGILKTYQIPHDFEIYSGNHINHVADRLETKTLPFFSRNLAGAGH